MARSGKTRKILWAKSGNLCAICRKKLVVGPTKVDPESVVGEECHIHAQSPGGHRYNRSYSAEQIDSLANLILLCPNDHKLVDDQHQEHSAEWLQAKKASHEKWVEDKLTERADLPQLRIVRAKANVPQKMDRISSGKLLLNLSTQCHSSNTDYDDDLDDAEAELVSSFLQDVNDYREIAPEVSMAEHMNIARGLSTRLRDLEQQGFYFFAAVENASIEGGEKPSQPWMIFHQMVTRATNPRIFWKEEVASSEPPQ